jgi:hypothetical protein
MVTKRAGKVGGIRPIVFAIYRPGIPGRDRQFRYATPTASRVGRAELRSRPLQPYKHDIVCVAAAPRASLALAAISAKHLRRSDGPSPLGQATRYLALTSAEAPLPPSAKVIERGHRLGRRQTRSESAAPMHAA